MITVEDPTGEINIIVSSANKKQFQIASNIVEDEVIGVSGSNSGPFVFCNELVMPEVPATNELKKGPEDENAIFISDLHIGSNYFLEKEFERFLSWLNGETGNAEQREAADKVKYVFIMGDLVDGIGIYPNQNKELEITNIEGQYDRCATFLKSISKEKHIIVCPGNHDAVRIAEPQPEIPKELAKGLYQLNNLEMTTNPSSVLIQQTEKFSGLNVLLYHGYSFDYFVANVDSIRMQGGYERPDLIMKLLLQRRHLAPCHYSTLTIPDPDQDMLIMNQVPDILATGHIHRAALAEYRNVTMICGSCWQDTTNFQKKVGHVPEPARVPLINLATRQGRLLKFIK
jgi:DNA polymerase II small subunit